MHRNAPLCFVSGSLFNAQLAVDLSLTFYLNILYMTKVPSRLHQEKGCQHKMMLVVLNAEPPRTPHVVFL